MASLQTLATRIVSLAADIEAAMCRWLMLIAEFDRREGWVAEGCPNTAQWIAWKCAVSPTTAREYVRVACRLEELPAVRAAFAKAELTYSKVRAITRIESVTREVEIVELARNMTAAQLERTVAAYGGVVRVEQGAEEALAERYVDWSIDHDGSILLRGRLPAEQGQIFVKAIEAASEALERSASADAPDGQTLRESPNVLRADALVDIADNALAGAQSSSTGGDRFQVVVHVEASALQDDDSATSRLDSGAPLADETARRLSCDASLVRIIEKDGRPLSVGRKTRSIPPALRRALRSRDTGCQFPGCERTHHVDAHHIEHWAHGGETSLPNLVTLCRFHHRLVHEGGFSVTYVNGDHVFTAPDGHRLSRAPRMRGECSSLPGVSAATSLQRMYERLDLGLAVDALLVMAPIDSRQRQDE